MQNNYKKLFSFKIYKWKTSASFWIFVIMQLLAEIHLGICCIFHAYGWWVWTFSSCYLNHCHQNCRQNTLRNSSSAQYTDRRRHLARCAIWKRRQIFRWRWMFLASEWFKGRHEMYLVNVIIIIFNINLKHQKYPYIEYMLLKFNEIFCNSWFIMSYSDYVRIFRTFFDQIIYCSTFLYFNEWIALIFIENELGINVQNKPHGKSTAYRLNVRKKKRLQDFGHI